MYLKIIISALLLVLLAVNVVPEEIEEEKPKGFIGYGGGFEWDFEVIQEDTDVFTEVEVINETTLEITIDKKHDLPSNYKWDMAICDTSGFDSLQYMEEDIQGGFEYSYPINLNYDKLTNYGMSNVWCEETDNYGFVLFSFGSENQLPKKFRIIFSDNKEKEFKMLTGSGSEVLIGTTIGSISYSYNEKIVKDSTGGLHLVWKDGSWDLQYANSTDNGATWSTKELKDAQTIDTPNLVINSTDGLFVIWQANFDFWYTTSGDYGVTWSTPTIIPSFDGNITHRWDKVSAVMDDNDNVHICGVTEEWDDNTNNDFLVYSNYTDGIWLTSFDWVNQDAANDTDYCDIETDSNGEVYITASGSDGKGIHLWTVGGTGLGGGNRFTIDATAFSSKPGIFIDANDKIVVAYELGSSDLGFANSTPNDATSNWDLTTVDTDSSDNPDVKITDYGDIYILYHSQDSFNNDVFMSNWSVDSQTWTARTLFKDSSSSTDPFPSMRGSRIGSNTITNRIDYIYIKPSDNGVYFDYFEVYTPPLPDTCSCPDSGDWGIDASDNCVISDDCDMQGNTVACYGTGILNLNAVISNFDNVFIHTGCNLYCRKTPSCFE